MNDKDHLQVRFEYNREDLLSLTTNLLDVICSFRDDRPFWEEIAKHPAVAGRPALHLALQDALGKDHETYEAWQTVARELQRLRGILVSDGVRFRVTPEGTTPAEK